MNVYLDMFDIDEMGESPIVPHKGASERFNAHCMYLFRYLLLADRVYMQGSAALKSNIIYRTYIQFKECFEKDEMSSRTPIASFVLREACEGYYDYFRLREQELLRNCETNNAEFYSYKLNNAKNISVKLDNSLQNVDYKRRERSVDKKFRYLVKTTFLDENFCKKHEIDSKTQHLSVDLCDNLDLFQTYRLLHRLGLFENKNVSHAIREKYYISNAFGVSSATTLAMDNIHLNYITVNYLFGAIGLSMATTPLSLLNSSSIFKIRRLQSFSKLKKIYFSKDSPTEINLLIQMLDNTRKSSGKYTALWKRSPQTFLSGFFEDLSELGVLPKFVAMPLYDWVIKYISDHEVIELIDIVKEFSRDISKIRSGN